MQILTSQKLRFYTPDRSASAVARPNQVEEVPDWAMHDEMFQAAKQAGLIKIIADAVSIPVQASVAVDNPPTLPTVNPEEDETPEDDGTPDVKSLTAKLGFKKIGETIALLKEKHNFVATNGKTLLSQELFDHVVASAAAPTPDTPVTTETAGGF